MPTTMTPEEIILESIAYTATRWGHTKWKTINDCEWKYHLIYNEKIHLKEPEAPFEIGKAAHSGRAASLLASLYGVDPILDSKPIWQHAIERADIADECVVRGDLINPKQEAIRLLQAYHGRYGNEHGGFGREARVLGVEELIEAPPELYYTTRVDAMVLFEGEPMNVDTKTRAMKPPDDFARRCIADSQFLGHTWCVWNATGKNIPMLVDVIVKTRDPQFFRFVIRYTTEQLEEWAWNRRRRAERALAVIDEPLRNFESCAPGIGSVCSHFDWCHGDDETRSRRYVKR